MFNLIIPECDEKLLEADSPLYKTIIASLERQLFEYVLRRSEGNQLKAARMLGINRNTMRAKIRKLGINAEQFKS